MPYKDLYSLLGSAEFQLPYLETKDDVSFLYHYDKRMRSYVTELEDLDQDAIGSIRKEVFLERIKLIVSSVKEILHIYLEGYPALAYSVFTNLVNKADLSTELIHLRTLPLETDHYLYRTKKEHNPDNSPCHGRDNGFQDLLKPIDLFHVPFEKRRAVGTNRFSIPGFPCLYLSDTLYTSWSECMNDENEAFHAICFRSHRPLYMADLAPINFKSKRFLKSHAGLLNDPDEFVGYAIVYPLIMACHSKIKYLPSYQGEIQFRSEYIVPQLLLQWYREKKLMVDGVRYLSCTAEERFPNKEFDKYNYVIPVIDIYESGHCNSLLVNYSTTPVYSYLQKPSDKDADEVIDDIVRLLNASTFTPLK